MRAEYPKPALQGVSKERKGMGSRRKDRMSLDMNVWRGFTFFVVTSALVVSAWLGNAPQACAQEANNSFKSFLSYFGMQPNAGDESIDYRARAPIAVPPRLDLPQPKAASRDPAWPKDPDAAAQRRAALDSHAPVAQAPANSGSVTPAADPEQGRGALTANGPRDDCEAGSGPALCLSTPWKLLKSMVNSIHPDTVQPGPEPARKFLTDPPPGYQQPAIAAKAAGEAPK
jgi:hypothetical protein